MSNTCMYPRGRAVRHRVAATRPHTPTPGAHPHTRSIKHEDRGSDSQSHIHHIDSGHTPKPIYVAKGAGTPCGLTMHASRPTHRRVRGPHRSAFTTDGQGPGPVSRQGLSCCVPCCVCARSEPSARQPQAHSFQAPHGLPAHSLGVPPQRPVSSQLAAAAVTPGLSTDHRVSKYKQTHIQLIGPS